MQREAKLGLAIFIGAGLIASALFSNYIFGSDASADSRAADTSIQLADNNPNATLAADAPATRTPAGPQPLSLEFDDGLPDIDAAMNFSMDADPVPGGARSVAVPTITPPRQRSYTVQNGDNLWKISEKMYGTGIYHSKIKAANPDIPKSGALDVGMTIVIPALNTPTVRKSAADLAPANAGSSSAATRRHVVRGGETLSDIARKYYGKSSAWVRIEKANPGLDPKKMRTGTVLRIP